MIDIFVEFEGKNIRLIFRFNAEGFLAIFGQNDEK